MASLVHPKASLPFRLPSLTPKTPSSNKLPFLSKPSNSQFLGAQISHHISPSSSSSSSFKFTISSKVLRFLLLGFVNFDWWFGFFCSYFWFWLLLGRWIRANPLRLSPWKIRMGGMWAFPNSKGSLWLSISTLLMRLLVAPSRYCFYAVKCDLTVLNCE